MVCDPRVQLGEAGLGSTKAQTKDVVLVAHTKLKYHMTEFGVCAGM